MNEKIIAQEYPDPKEEKIISGIVKDLKKSLQNEYGCHLEMYRRFHAKSHGLLDAEFKVEETLDAEWQVGLLKTPKTFKALVRFTNGAPQLSADYKRSVRGMAIKILDVDETLLEPDPLGNTQDIILTNNKIIFPGKIKAQPAAMRFLFFNKLYIFIVLSHEIKGIFTFLKGQVKTPSLFSQSYFSGTPYLFGNGQAIKWKAGPVKPVHSTMPANPGRDYLRERLSKDLLKDDYFFELFIQSQKNSETEPIENAAIEWKTDFIKVGTIKLLKQEFNTPGQNERDKKTLFSPWHSMAAHRPLGAINRIRRVVYKELSKIRNLHND